jgi:hypothetical protein
MQIVDRVPLEPHDQPLDILITETRIIRITHKEEPGDAQNSNI